VKKNKEFIDNRCRDHYQLETKSRKKKNLCDIGEKEKIIADKKENVIKVHCKP
jgi:hypothetical protein